MVANDARQAMGADVNQVTLLDASGGVEELPLLPKDEVAERVMDRVVKLLQGGLSTDWGNGLNGKRGGSHEQAME
jgi:hypothetical protein